MGFKALWLCSIVLQKCTFVTRSLRNGGGITVSGSLLRRFSVSMENDLLRKLDEFVLMKGYGNRSEAVRDLAREAIVEQLYDDSEQIIAGSILLFYEHHKRNLLEEMTEVQHDMHDLILATTHFHLDHGNCLEIIVVQGKVKDARQLSNKLISLKGVSYGKFTVAPVTKT